MVDKICVVGLGYVDLILSIAFSKKGHVISFDIDEASIRELEFGFTAKMLKGALVEWLKKK
tara:strand:+ start:222 stop:404 length:183 start_codon:yes stop_codon:yes gene_type:complete